MKILLLAAAAVRATFEADGKSPVVVLDNYTFKGKLLKNIYNLQCIEGGHSIT